MKKKLFFAAVAIVALASCVDNEYVGEVSPNPKTDGTNAIVFNSSAYTLTRADHVGADAADLLGEQFIVGGYKGGSEADGVAAASGVSTVFDNYRVNWAQNTAATTESNTSDWEYVGITAAAPATVTGEQTIKYWDFSASQYDFIAYSVGKGNTLVAKTTSDIATGTPESNQVWVTPIAPSTAKTAAYQLRGLKADLLECYIADLKTVLSDKYKEEVQLDFRRLASKVRIALYETIPGYSVKDVKFYVADDTPIKEGETGYEAPTTTATLFTSGSGNVFNSNGTYTISFPTIGTANNGKDDYNQAHVTFTADGTSGSGTTETFGTLDYTTAQRNETAGSYYLGRTSNAASYAKTSGTDYQYVLPNEDGAVLELRVDYTLVSIDGSGEEINIYGAKAFVPATYAKWNSNFAYTYIFKISDNTNGWTSNTEGAGKEGLYPITFDAVITEAENYNKQTTITTVATPSITTYQKGHDITKEEYGASTTDSIYVQVMNNSTLATDLSSNGKLYAITARSGKTITEADVMDALNIQESSTTTAITGRNGWVLTEANVKHADGGTAATSFGWIPCIDGNNILVASGTASRFEATAGTYAYVYDATPVPAPGATYIYTAVEFTTSSTEPSDWSGNYWDNPDGTGSAVTTFAAPTTGTKYYYRRYTNNNKVYGVKVIKVQ